MKKLTPRQRQIFDYVRAHITNHGYAPTVREIAKVINISISTIQGHLTKLQEKGYINRVPKSPRAITLSEMESEVEVIKSKRGEPTVIVWRGRRFAHDPSTIGKAKR